MSSGNMSSSSMWLYQKALKPATCRRMKLLRRKSTVQDVKRESVSICNVEPVYSQDETMDSLW
jgi:hypothetical protein